MASKRKSKRGGKRAGSGRKPAGGLKASRAVQIRLTPHDYAALERAAASAGASGSRWAALAVLEKISDFVELEEPA